MADSTRVAVAKAITTELTSAFAASTFGAAYAAVVPERSWADWEEELEDLSTLRADVVPVSAKLTMLTRGLWRWLVATDVGIRFRFGPSQQTGGRITVAEIDTLDDLVENVAEYFAPCPPTREARRLAAVPTAVWAPTGEGGEGGSNLRVSAPREHLRELRQFTGIVRISYFVPKRAA